MSTIRQRKIVQRGPQNRRPANWRPLPTGAHDTAPDANAYLHCGWGRLIFAHTFERVEDLVEILRREAPDERDMAFYVKDPHVALALAPQELFLDPSHAYRLPLANYRPRRSRPHGFFIRRLRGREDVTAMNRIYAQQEMVPVPRNFVLHNKGSRRLTYLVAEDQSSGEVIGTVTGVDHVRTFNDPERAASLWCLAVDPQAAYPGVGEFLVRHLTEHYLARGLAWLDLSVMHDNEQAIALYEKLGFQRLPAFCLKHKNPINERLFTGPQPERRLNPYAQIIINEARRRGIGVDIEDEDAALFTLSHGGRRVHCRESLSDLTSAVAVARCDDKALTHRLLSAAGLRVPAQIEAGDEDEEREFLRRYERIVVKPARGEQGTGVSVDVREDEALKAAIKQASTADTRVLLEQYCDGEDLRIIVIADKVVAAAIRRPAAVTGDGNSTIADLIAVQSRRRAATTGGESRIPVDAETRRCVDMAGYDLDSVLPEGEYLEVRKTANLHTGGTIVDTTGVLHPALAKAARTAARVLDIPVVGLDFLVAAADRPDHVIVEANERPGLANHEPQPTAERFVDLLFPQTAEASQ